jgi:hypothetical protein
MQQTRREWLTAMGVLGSSAAVLGAASTPVGAQENGETDGGDGDSGNDDGDTGDGGDGNGEPEQASALRVAHFSGDAPNVDVFVDGEAALTDVPYGIVSDYLQVTAGDHTVEITAAGDPDTVVFSGDVTVEPWTAYTAAAIGSLTEDSFEVLVLEDNDLAQVRLLHAVPDAPAVDVTTGEGDEMETLFDGVEFGEATDYVTVAAGQYTLTVRPDTEDDDGDAVADVDVYVAPGGVYTVVARGFLSEDAPEGAALTVDALPDVATAGLGISDLLIRDTDDEGDDGDGGDGGDGDMGDGGDGGDDGDGGDSGDGDTGDDGDGGDGGDGGMGDGGDGDTGDGGDSENGGSS